MVTGATSTVCEVVGYELGKLHLCCWQRSTLMLVAERVVVALTNGVKPASRWG